MIYGRTLIKPVAFALLALAGVPVSAQTLPKVYPVVTPDDADSRSCGITAAATDSAVTTTLQSSGVTVATRDQPGGGENTVVLLVEFLPVAISDDACAITVGVTFMDMQVVETPDRRKTMLAAVDYCERMSILTGQRVGLQSRLDGQVKGLIIACLGKLENDLKTAR